MSRGSDSHAMSAMAGSNGTGHFQTGSDAMVGSVLRLVMGVMSVKNVYVIGGLGLSTSGGMPSARVQDVHGYLRLRHDQWGLSTESGHWPTQCTAREGRPLQRTRLRDKGGGWDQNLCGRVWHELRPIPVTCFKAFITRKPPRFDSGSWTYTSVKTACLVHRSVIMTGPCESQTKGI